MLTEHVIQKMKTEGPFDILLVTGDVAGHFFAQEPNAPYNPKLYDALLQIHRNFSRVMAREFPNTLVVPTFGNNDF